MEENIYVRPPKELESLEGTGQIRKLRKAIYGLKQSGRAWNKKLNTVLKEIGLRQSEADPCIYYNTNKSERIIIAVYVDDLLILYNDKKTKNDIKRKLTNNFEMKDLGPVKNCLGMTITRSKKQGKLWIYQMSYIHKILERFGMTNCNPIATSMDPQTKLSRDMEPNDASEIEEMKGIPYKEAVGSLMYLCQISRPDISFAVNMVSRYSQNPGRAH